MRGKRETDDRLLSNFRAVIARYPGISQGKYDALVFPHKPGRATILRRFGCSWAELRSRAFDGTPPEVEPEPEAEEQLASRTFLVAQNDRLRRDLDKQRNLTAAFCENCLAEIGKLGIRPLPVPKPCRSQERLDFHALRSDAQVGERIDPRAVQGLSVYNAEVYAERVSRWTEKVILFREQDRASLGLNKLVIEHLGDQVEGESIYPGQPFYLDLHLTEQIFYSVEVEASAILALAAEFPEVEIYAVSGNHGRAGKKGDHSGINFDYIFYRALKAALSRQSNVNMYIAESPSMLVRHGDFNFLLAHGDAAKSWNGIPYYGIDRQFRRMHDLFGVRVDVELIGHHHQHANLSDRVLVNGCLPGGSDLSINRMGVSSVPSQKIFYFDEHHGINRESNLYLAEPVILEHDEYGIATAWA